MLAAIGVILLPPGLLYGAGVRVAQFENRALVPFPSAADGWDFFPQLSGWAADNLPLREQGIDVSAWIDSTLFGDPTGPPPAAGTNPLEPNVSAPTRPQPWTYAGYPQVIFGRDGLLFYGGDFAKLCEPTRSADDIVQAARRLATAVQQSGRRLVLVIPPDKSEVLSDYLPDDVVGAECRAERIRQLDEQLASQAYVIDLRPSLAALAAVSDEPVYMDKDSHWDGAGAAVMVRALVEALQPDVGPSLRERRQAKQTGTGDLTVLSGSSASVTYHPVRLSAWSVRANWSSVDTIDSVPRRYVSTGPAGTLVTGRTLLIGDSYALAARSTLPGVFADMTQLHVSTIAAAPARLVQQMVDADTVVVEIVQREFYSGDSDLFDDDFLDAAVRELAANPR